MFGTLKIMTYVVVPSVDKHGDTSKHDKCVTVASIPCHFDEREPTFSRFIEMNPWMSARHLFAEFTLRTHVRNLDL